MMKKGFTLMELLVVVLIVGILSAVALPQYEKAVEKSRSAEALSLLKSIHQAQKIYFMQTGTHTSKLDDLDITFSGAADHDMGSGITGKKTKYFVYYTNFDSNGSTGLAARRLNTDNTTLYAFNIGESGQDDLWRCCYMQEKYKDLCRVMGFTNNAGGGYFAGSLGCFFQ